MGISSITNRSRDMTGNQSERTPGTPAERLISFLFSVLAGRIFLFCMLA